MGAVHFACWRSGHDWSDLSAGTRAQPDGIGILEEYAFGSDPASGSPDVAPKAGFEAGDVTLTYQLERARTDLSVQIEESTDLVTWIPASVTSTSTVANNGTIRTYKAKVPLSGADKKFLRIKLSALTN